MLLSCEVAPILRGHAGWSHAGTPIGCCANIAEGFGRYKPKLFANSLRVSRGSLLELKDHLLNAHKLGLIGENDLRDLSHLANRAVGALTRLIAYLDTAKEP